MIESRFLSMIITKDEFSSMKEDGRIRDYHVMCADFFHSDEEGEWLRVHVRVAPDRLDQVLKEILGEEA